MRVTNQRDDAGTDRHDRHGLLADLLSSDALRTGTLVDALQTLSRALCTSLGVDRVSVAVRDAELEELVFAEAYVAESSAHAPPFLASGVEPLTVFKFAELGVPLVADDVTAHPSLAPFLDRIFRPVDIRALMQVPVDVNGRMIGVFNVSVCGRPWHWTAEQIKTGMAIASLAALVIERHGRRHVVAQRSAAEERLEAQQATLSRLMRENSHNGRSLEQELRILSEATAATLGVERVSFWRLQPDNSAIVAIDMHDTRDGSHASGVSLLRKDHNAYFDAILSSGMLVVNDIKSDPRTESFVAGYVSATGVTALLDMAIINNQRTIGVVCIETCRPHNAWSEEQKLFAASVTSLAALAIERHERLRAEAGVRETSRRLSSHFMAVNAIMQSDALHRGGFEEALRHLSRALCHEIRADGVALNIRNAGDAPAYAEVYSADLDAHAASTRTEADAAPHAQSEADREGLKERADGYSLSVPVRFHGEIVGNVYAWTNRRDNAWAPGELLMASIITHLTTLVLERSNRLHVEKNLRDANRTAEDASRAKSQFLANMSHEIRTPMNGVFGMTDLLLQTPLTGRQHQIVGTIQQSTASLLTIINDILDISRIESGRVELEAKPFQLKACIEGAAALFAEEAKRKSIDLTVDIASTCPAWLLGDTARLRQVCVNLIGNALKFTMKGAIAVRVEDATTANGDTQLRFRITDTGIGIDPAVQQRLFQPFTQADGSITRRFGGTGLGLSISRSLIEMMGGKISIDSHPGAGTTVAFDACLKKASASTTAESSTATLTAWFAGAPNTNTTTNTSDNTPQSPKLQRRFNGHVLVAEDNPVNQEVTRELVGALGCTVTCVENGAAAVQAYEQQSFDLVLMDCQMPIMDGLTATQQIRKIEAERQSTRVAIVAVTANAFAEDRHACLDAGMDGYLSKPFNGNQLDTILQRWLPAHLIIERRGIPTRPATIDATDQPDLDPIVLEPMKRLRTDFYRRLLSTFLRHTPRLVEGIVEAAQKRDLAGLRLAAHSLKSSSANVGASRMSALARDAEVAASRNAPFDFDQLSTDITAAFASVRTIFEAELSAIEAAQPLAKQA